MAIDIDSSAAQAGAMKAAADEALQQALESGDPGDLLRAQQLQADYELFVQSLTKWMETESQVNQAITESY